MKLAPIALYAAWLGAICVAPLARAGSVVLSAATLNNGVDAMGTTAYRLTASVGETFSAGSMTGTGYTLRPGFPSNSVALSTGVALTSGTNPSQFSQDVTLTVTVTGDSPTGTVAFQDGGTNISGCEAKALANGTAQCTTTFTVGSHNLTAVYGGDTYNAGATSPVVTQSVTKADQTIQAVNRPSSLMVGSQVQLQDTASSGLPVSYDSPSTTVCTVTTVSGITTLAGVSAGTCTVDVNQAGNSDYNPAPTSTYTITIYPNQPGTLAFSVVSTKVMESGLQVTLTVDRTDGAAGAVSVQYATANGTATAGTDYTTTSGTLNWADGETGGKNITVPIINNHVKGADKDFTVTLSNPTGNATLGSPATEKITIRDRGGLPIAVLMLLLD